MSMVKIGKGKKRLSSLFDLVRVKGVVRSAVRRNSWRKNLTMSTGIASVTGSGSPVICFLWVQIPFERFGADDRTWTCMRLSLTRTWTLRVCHFATSANYKDYYKLESVKNQLLFCKTKICKIILILLTIFCFSVRIM